ncbi:MAG: signal recognition particle receptor subunit alpha, partial [Alphaproteobacteria bacterium]|nr:signal recognition particle receptor subunit alpha [Alphaproteobacteria bacterium]
MFDGLTDRFGEIFDRLKKRGALSEADVTAAMREIRVALLEADVALPVVKDFIDGVRERAIGEEVLRSITPGQQVVKIVNDYLTEMLGPESEEFEVRAAAPAAVMMVGLQGSGKTTTSAKIAKRIQEKQFKKVLMASLDVRRPAAQQQLEILGKQANVATLEIVPFQTPRMIADRAMDTAKK